MSLFSIQSDFDHWFSASVGDPTPIQTAAWPVLRQRENALLIAPTGQGKSLAAWRVLVEQLLETPPRATGVRVLHIAPLKALARDMTLNLEPLLRFAGRLKGAPVTIGLRCGDTPATERALQLRRPPEILATTPESLFVLLGSKGGRRLLRSVEAVVVDELHALAPGKRGAHLTLSLARLDALCGAPVQRVGLSATAHPSALLASFLSPDRDCRVIEPQRAQAPTVVLELPEVPLGPFAHTVHWQQIHQRVAGLARRDRALLVFCQTRAQVERTAAALGELLGDSAVGAHHGSLDRGHREAVEQCFKTGKLNVLVSSASLELGLDLGFVDRVCQLGAPGSLNLLRQRAGRSGHRPGQRPCVHLFPLTLNQLVEAEALIDALEAGRMDRIRIPAAPLDVLAQQLIAMVAGGVDRREGLLKICRRAYPWRELAATELDVVLDSIIAQPESLPETQCRQWIRAVCDGQGAKRLVPDGDAEMASLCNAGVIPEWFEYEVVRTDTGATVGRLDEEYAFESSPGQVIQLGHRCWRIVRVLTGQVRVEPADQETPDLPFWFGEGPGRSDEVAGAMLERIRLGARAPQARSMLAAAHRALGGLPDAGTLLIERFPDPGGDLHVVLHTFAGARINRAWGLALRKRFCRQFNFELQAAATDDGILISLGITAQFELDKIAAFVSSAQAEDVLTQALLDTPMFVTRFRWCASNALGILSRDRNGPVPAQRQRSQAENLIASVFPDQLACLENLSGPRRIPDHPLVRQALDDCLRDYMDIDGLTRLLQEIEQGRVRVRTRDLAHPSTLAEALIHAPRHSFLDEAAAEERRTRNFEQMANGNRAGSQRRPPHSRARTVPTPVPNLAAESVVRSCPGRPGLRARAADLEQLLMDCGFLTAVEGEAGLGLARPVAAGGWSRTFSTLVREKRALTVTAGPGSPALWVAIGRLGWFIQLNPALEFRPWMSLSLVAEPPGGTDAALRWLLAGRAGIDGARAPELIARALQIAPARVARAGIAAVG
ncbi:MAG: DEAD/DEAH box helicase [Xanthomonadaceae bacterium]|nr:DEAD/DEAH box helicase [Xanthomonadaceae bacterium]